MAFSSLQARGSTLRAAFGLALLATTMAGCMSRDPTSTGSISFGAPRGTEADLRQQAQSLGSRYDAKTARPEAALEYARVLRALGRTSEAVAVLQQAAIRAPNHSGLLAAYGKVLADTGRYREAATVLANSHRPEHPDWRILSTQGAVADQLGDFEGAQRFYAAALKIVPGEPTVLANQGLSFALAKRLDEAERILTFAAQNPRADARVRRNLALVLGLRGRFAEAEAMLRRDLPPQQAGEAMAGIRSMVHQANNWKAIKQGDKAPRSKGAPLAQDIPQNLDTPPPAREALDARRPVRQSAGL